ncbi:MAG TPA: lasso peptide biosynthesis protein [Rectinemataceae bacterium]
MRYKGYELSLLLGAWARLALADVRLRCLPWSWNRAWVFRGDPALLPEPEGRARGRAAEVYAAVSAAGSKSGPFLMSCLRRALVARAILGREGIRMEIAFGRVKAKKASPGVTFAHAWLQAGNFSVGRGSEEGIEPLSPLEMRIKLGAKSGVAPGGEAGSGA